MYYIYNVCQTLVFDIKVKKYNIQQIMLHFCRIFYKYVSFVSVLVAFCHFFVAFYS